LAGCNKQATVESFTPKGDVAKDALTAGLTAWQNGRPKPGLIENTKPAVQIIDPAWEAGSKLKSFEIGPAAAGDSPRKFPVKLFFEGAAAPEEITFYVVGKDPLWVMREQEYNRNSEM
jgi:hypothetical protein